MLNVCGLVVYRSMNAELAKHSKDNQNYGLYERRYDTVVKEVRALEGQLADFNLALDKVSTQPRSALLCSALLGFAGDRYERA
jgi:hypothetical protein